MAKKSKQLIDRVVPALSISRDIAKNWLAKLTDAQQKQLSECTTADQMRGVVAEIETERKRVPVLDTERTERDEPND